MSKNWTVDEEARRLHARFDALKAEPGIGQAEFARKFEVPGGPSMVSQHIKGRRPMTLEAAISYAKGFQCSLSEISPRLALEVAKAGSVGKVVALRTEEISEDDVHIPQYAAGGAMGSGLVLEEKQPGLIKSWRVDHEWLRLNVGHHTGVQNLCIVTGFGPSMKPKFNPGDPLLLDMGVVTVEAEGIYFFRVGQHGFIKQLQRIPTERGLILRAKSLNPNYDPFDITTKMIAQDGHFQVFGKVLTVWKSEQV